MGVGDKDVKVIEEASAVRVILAKRTRDGGG
jgi:hypothetical protein